MSGIGMTIGSVPYVYKKVGLDGIEMPAGSELIVSTSFEESTEAIELLVEGAEIWSSLTPVTDGRSTSLVDLNTFVGSSDAFRNAVGGYFYNEFDSFGNLQVPPLFYKFIPTQNPNPHIWSVHSVTNAYVNENAGPLSERGLSDAEDVAARGYGDSATAATAQNLILPYVQFVVAVEGDPDSPDLKEVTKGNKYWQLLFTGGEYLYQKIDPIWTPGVYDDHFMVTSYPYQNIEKQYLVNPENVKNYIASVYDYNHYLPNYQRFVSQITNELTLPNWYVTTLVSRTPSESEVTLAEMMSVTTPTLGTPMISEKPSEKVLNPNIVDYYTCGGTKPLEKTGDDLRWPPVTSDSSGGTDEEEIKPPPPTYLTPYWEIPYSVYLNDEFPGSFAYISASSMNYIKSRFKNLLFNDSATSRFLKQKESGDSDFGLHGMLPFYNRISFPTMPSGPYSMLMAEHEYSTFFLRTLKETFLMQNSDSISMETCQFLRNESFLSASASKLSDEKSSTSSVVEYKSIDLMKMLLYSYNTVFNDYEDFFVMDYENLDCKAAEDAAGVYRAYNTKNVAKVINGILSSLAPTTTRFNINSIFKILNSQDPVSPMSVSDPEALHSITPSPKQNEVIAYRIEKIGGDITGDSMTQQALQNFWIFNNPDLENLDFIDSQVKYDTNYTYNVYAYYIVGGFKYKYHDLRISKIIGQVNEDGYSGPLELGTGITAAPPPPPTAYCVEYYNPYTGERKSDLLENSMATYGAAAKEEISRYASDAQRIAASAKYLGDDGDSEYVKVMPPYKAQFLVTCQPSIKLMEVPLLSKSYKILDQPPNPVNVVPNHVLGNGNQLSFDIFYETKSPETYPRVILESDEVRKQEFLKANDILNTTDIVKPSISPQTFVEVYKLPQKPKSFRDFSGNLIKTVPLGIENSNFSYTTATFNDIVKSNHKYYYLFRTINANNIAGNVDTIVEAQIVNDGGYKYASFETLFEQDLEVESHKETSRKFKNLFQLTPNFSQTNIVTKEADYSLPSIENFEKVTIGNADDLIWDKTFKIRLTSKKTGKKIDLNITYSDPDVSLQEILAEDPNE